MQSKGSMQSWGDDNDNGRFEFVDKGANAGGKKGGKGGKKGKK